MAVKSKHHNHRTQYDLTGDLEKLKAALFDTTQDITGKAGEMFNESVGNIKEQSVMMRDQVAGFAAKRPFKALGWTLLAGVTLGYLIRRTNRE